MKNLFIVTSIVIFFNSQFAFANQATKCFEIAWEHPSNGGLGLMRGHAIELCKGARDAIEVIRCYEKAWDHPSNGGLGLTRGRAIDLCKPCTPSGNY